MKTCTVIQYVSRDPQTMHFSSSYIQSNYENLYSNSIRFSRPTDEAINNVKSDIHAWVKLPFLAKNQGPVRVPMPRETNQPLCRYLTTGCPVNPGVTTTIKKSVTIPLQARMVCVCVCDSVF